MSTTPWSPAPTTPFPASAGLERPRSVRARTAAPPPPHTRSPAPSPAYEPAWVPSWMTDSWSQFRFANPQSLDWSMLSGLY